MLVLSYFRGHYDIYLIWWTGQWGLLSSDGVSSIMAEGQYLVHLIHCEDILFVNSSLISDDVIRQNITNFYLPLTCLSNVTSRKNKI